MPKALPEGARRVEAVDADAESILVDSSLNCRKYSKRDIGELASKILRDGQLEPIAVRRVTKPEGPRLQLVFGYGRLAAIRYINEMELVTPPLTVRCVVRDGDDKHSFLSSLAENHDREDLTPIDYAYSCDRLITEWGMNQREMAEYFGRTEGWVSMILSLNSLPAKIQKDVHTGKLPASTAYELAKAPEEQRESILEEATREANPETSPPSTGAKEEAAPTRAAVKRKVKQKAGEDTPRTLKEIRGYWETLAEVESGADATELQVLAKSFLEFMDRKIGERAMTKRLEGAVN